MENFIDTKTAIERTGMTRSGLTRLAKLGKVAAVKLGNAWLYAVGSLDAYLAEMRDAGKSKHDPRRNPDWTRSDDAGRPRRVDGDK